MSIIKICPICNKEFKVPQCREKTAIYCSRTCRTKATNIEGKKFGRLTVIKKIGFSKTSHSTKYLCQCECGNNCEVSMNNLKTGHTTSCGCLKGRFTHNKYKTRIFRIYYNMLQRCNNPNNRWYKNYGARGILVCKEWQDDFMNFYNWAIQNNYSDDLTLDRIDVNGNYEPLNCRWVTKTTQQNNMRTNHFFTYNGETHTGSEWARKVGVSPHFLYGRLRSHTFEDFIKDYI